MKSKLKVNLKDMGYKYAVMLKSNKNEFWATKEDKIGKDFSDDSKWDCFTLDQGEKWFKLDRKEPYGVIYKV